MCVGWRRCSVFAWRPFVHAHVALRVLMRRQSARDVTQYGNMPLWAAGLGFAGDSC